MDPKVAVWAGVILLLEAAILGLAVVFVGLLVILGLGRVERTTREALRKVAAGAEKGEEMVYRGSTLALTPILFIASASAGARAFLRALFSGIRRD